MHPNAHYAGNGMPSIATLRTVHTTLYTQHSVYEMMRTHLMARLRSEKASTNLRMVPPRARSPPHPPRVQTCVL